MKATPGKHQFFQPDNRDRWHLRELTNKGNCDAGGNSMRVCLIISPSTLQKPFVKLLQRRLLRPVSQFLRLLMKSTKPSHNSDPVVLQGSVVSLLKAGGACCTEWLTNIICKAWDTGSAHDDWKKGIILPFYKGKGSRTDCRNYRDITLLSVPGKVYAHVLLNRIKARLHHLRRTKQWFYTSQINHRSYCYPQHDSTDKT